MKLLKAILKDLQDSGQQAAIVGQYSIQTGHFQDVAEIDNAYDLPKTAYSVTDKSKGANRYTAEQEQNGTGGLYPVTPPIVLLPDLVDIVEAWPKLPDSMRAGILAMVKAVSK